MIRCPKPGERTPWDPFPLPSRPKPSKGGSLLETIIEILTGRKK